MNTHAQMSEQESKRLEALIASVIHGKSLRERMRADIEKASSDDFAPIMKPRDIRLATTRYPRFDLALEHLDAIEGGYGVTVIGARPRTGKSTLAIGISLLQALAGVPVVLLDAENPAELAMRRVSRFFGGDTCRFDALVDAGLFNWVEVETGHSIKQIVQLVLDTFSDEGALVVFDSFNSISLMLDEYPEYDAKTKRWIKPPQGDYFRNLRKRAMWMNTVTKRTEGRIRFLALSELNKEGGLKGLELEHVASVIVSMEREDPMVPGVVRVRMPKNRDGLEDPVGKLYDLDWRTSKFIRKDDLSADA